jgi:phage terminase large subunit
MAGHSIKIDDLKIEFDGKVIYDPLPQQKKFHLSTAKYRLLGGSAGGGKTIALMAEAIMRSMKYDFPLTGAIFRRSYPELESTIIRGMLEMLPRWFYKYNQSQHVLTLKNGSIIEFCYAETDNDVTRYQSREWDWTGVDELTHFSLFQWSYLMSRMRTTKPINTKFFAGTNPGGKGHNWVKERWVSKSCDEENYEPRDYDFIPAGVLDNPYLMEANPDYIENLKMLPEKERKALLEGNWDIFEGAFFPEWSHSRHVVDDFDVPEDWQLILGWDDGTREPRAVNLYAIDNDQQVWCIWEYYEAGENLTQAAENIRRELKEKGYWGRIYKLVVDPSMKRTDSQTGLSSTEVLEGMGYGFQIGSVELGNNKRVEGWRVVKTYLSHKPYEEPLLKFFKSCGNIIRTIPQLTYYQSRTSRVSKKEDLDTTQEDHSADNLRYVLMSLGRLPSRFESSSFVKAKRRKYSPRSIYN